MGNPTTGELIAVASIEDIRAGEMKGFKIKGKEIMVVNYAGKYYAVEQKCTHRGGDLAKGRLEDKVVTCPRHGSEFDVTTGECVKGPAKKNLPVYTVQVDGGSIKIVL